MSPARKRRRWVIAIDGPAGVGKSTVGHLVAKSLGYRFINTGEMYRALTWKVLEENIDFRAAGKVARLAKRLKWEFRPTEEGTTLKTTLDGEAVTVHIRDERVSRNSSLVAGIPEVRRFLRKLQRDLGRDGGIVMEGRDITTNVFADAEVKVYLDASIEERALRRYRQLKASGHEGSLDRIQEGILSRDRMDLERKINPLRQTEDSVFIDSTRLSLREVAQRILECVRERRRGLSR
ncbi:MAG: (d)CMP kinase [Elusimicrobia bacterium]|nr:(d)CMP kinase [Elusimicrobiota bacterium]